MDDANTNLEANAVDSSKATLSEVMPTEWHKLILLSDISEFGWKTIEEYTQHELADDEADCKKIWRAEAKAKKAFTSASSSSWVPLQSYRSRANIGYVRKESKWAVAIYMIFCLHTRAISCFACCTFCHWRLECPQIHLALKDISGKSTMKVSVHLFFCFSQLCFG